MATLTTCGLLAISTSRSSPMPRQMGGAEFDTAMDDAPVASNRGGTRQFAVGPKRRLEGDRG